FGIALEEKLKDKGSTTGSILLALLQTLPRQRQTYKSPLAELCLAAKDHYPGISSSALLQGGNLNQLRASLDAQAISTADLAQIEAEKTQKEEETREGDHEEKETTEETAEPKAEVESSAEQKEPEAGDEELEGQAKDINSILAPKEDAKKPEEKKDGKEGKTKRRDSPDTQIADDDALINIQEALGELIYLADLTDHDLEDKMAYLASEECINGKEYSFSSRRVNTRDLKESFIKGMLHVHRGMRPRRRGIPMHYSDLSLEAQEEIDIQVVIDFEEALATNDIRGKTKPSGWRMEKLVLECFVGSIKSEMQMYLHDIQANWKPGLKYIDPGGDSDTDYISDCSDSRGTIRSSRRRRAQMN
ncbi:hypothetical protein FOXB_14467, partial [Fusarium oxysporum f. sp. conglutinans Fo5176]